MAQPCGGLVDALRSYATVVKYVSSDRDIVVTWSSGGRSRLICEGDDRAALVEGEVIGDEELDYVYLDPQNGQKERLYINLHRDFAPEVEFFDVQSEPINPMYVEIPADDHLVFGYSVLMCQAGSGQLNDDWMCEGAVYRVETQGVRATVTRDGAPLLSLSVPQRIAEGL
jgi:hypothetical protein